MDTWEAVHTGKGLVCFNGDVMTLLVSCRVIDAAVVVIGYLHYQLSTVAILYDISGYQVSLDTRFTAQCSPCAHADNRTIRRVTVTYCDVNRHAILQTCSWAYRFILEIAELESCTRTNICPHCNCTHSRDLKKFLHPRPNPCLYVTIPICRFSQQRLAYNFVRMFSQNI